MMPAANNVPVEVWSMVVSEMARGRASPRAMLAVLVVNKALVAAARKALGALVRVRCTVERVPRAIVVFEGARELRVVGHAEEAGGADGAEGAEGAEGAAAARAALERAGRFCVLVSDATDASRMAWMPRNERGLKVVCECWENKPFGGAGTDLALARATELEIDYLGSACAYPDLSRIAAERVTILQADFADGLAAHAGFGSAAVTRLTFEACEMAALPPMTGFPNLKALELVGCVFTDETGGALRSLDEPALPIEHLRMEKCEGKLIDASPLGAMPKLRHLAMHGCRGEFPDFDAAAAVALKAKLLRGEVTAVCLCKLIVRRLDIRRAEREAARLVQCACCGPCECGECSDCE